MLLDHAGIIQLAGAVFGLYYIYSEIKVNHSAVNPIILFCLSMSITSVANFIGIQSFGKETEYVYNLYADEGSLIEAFLYKLFRINTIGYRISTWNKY